MGVALLGAKTHDMAAASPFRAHAREGNRTASVVVMEIAHGAMLKSKVSTSLRKRVCHEKGPP